MNELINEQKQVFFSVKEGSNYKVLMTYDREEVIEYEQYKKLAQALNSVDVQFITINQRIVNKSTIIDISPTTAITDKQRKKREADRLEKEKNQKALEKIHNHRQAKFEEYFNEKFGIGNWCRYKTLFSIRKFDDERVELTEKDCNEFYKKYAFDFPEKNEEEGKLKKILAK